MDLLDLPILHLADAQMYVVLAIFITFATLLTSFIGRKEEELTIPDHIIKSGCLWLMGGSNASVLLILYTMCIRNQFSCLTWWEIGVVVAHSGLLLLVMLLMFFWWREIGRKVRPPSKPAIPSTDVV